MASGMFTAAVAWWKETTDVTILCSPWVCRPVGRWVRTGTILANVFWWACFYLKHPPSLNGIALQSRGFASLDSGFNVLIVILMWYFWAASLWYYFMAAWESFSGSLFFCLRCFTQLSISSFQCCRSGPFRFSGLSICNPMSFQCASSHHCTHLGMRFLRYWNHLNTKLWRSLCSTVLGAYANIFLHCLGCLSFGL